MTRSDWKVGGDRAVMKYRHPLVTKLTNLLHALAHCTDPSKRKVRWTPQAAGLTAVLMTLDGAGGLKARFTHVLTCVNGVLRGRRRVGQSYNGLMKALVRQESTVLPTLRSDLRDQTLKLLWSLPHQRGFGHWIVLGVDGSKQALPRTADHEAFFGIADNGKGPQAFMTSIVHVETGLLWDWRVGEARASEKKHLEDMIDDLPERTLLLGDGNFVGHPIWLKLLTRGVDFLVRVGGNVGLLTNRQPHGSAAMEVKSGIVYVWPPARRRSDPPLRLRLIRLEGPQGVIHLLTSVLDKRRLSDGAAVRLYRMRWGVEVFYRTLKQTLGLGKLRSASSRRAAVALQWGLLTVAIMGLLALPAILHAHHAPHRLSPAGVLHVLRATLRSPCLQQAVRAEAALMKRLSQAVKDTYVRRNVKDARHRPVTRNTPFPITLKPPRLTHIDTPLHQLAFMKTTEND